MIASLYLIQFQDVSAMHKPGQPYNQTRVDEFNEKRELEAAELKTKQQEALMKSSGPMPICKEGESPISKWMNTNNVTINEKGEVESEPIFESCIKPEKKIGAAIILYPIE